MAAGPRPDAERPDCLHCIYSLVTWEAGRPRGCRAYEFKSAELASDVVLASSGEACGCFERKPGSKPKARLLR